MRRIVRILAVTCIALLLGDAGLAQDESAEEADANEIDAPAETTAETDDDSDVVETNDESYLDIDDEDFRPSEEIPADQSITFPTDI